MTSQRLLFGEFQPDQPAFLNEGLIVADGCYPVKNGYAPVGGFFPAPNGGLPNICLGGSAYRVAGATYSFAADAGNLYRYGASGYTNLKTGLTNNLGVQFAPYSTLMLITNGTDPVQKFTPSPTNAVTALGGSPPIARYVGIVGGFTVLAYASNSPLRVAWSNQGNPEQWTPSTASEAGVLDMATGGDITGFVGGEYGLIFQENRVTRMTYTASDTVWQFDPLGQDVGCVLPGSIATWNKLTFFLSNRGFMMCDGSSITPIGAEKVDRWFQNTADRSYFDNVSAVIDPRNSLYIMTLPNTFPFGTVLIYNYVLQRWSTAKVTTERLIYGLAQPTSLDALDAMYPNLDALTISLDSVAFRGGYPLLLLYNGQHQLGSLSGAPVDATFVDATRELVPGQRARITAVRPMTDAKAAQVTIACQDSLADAPTATTYVDRRGSGTFRVRESANLCAITVSIPSQTWTFVQGVDVDAVAGGRA
jgi:hypothetical protein